MNDLEGGVEMKDVTTPEAYASLVENHPRGHFLQSLEWTNVKKSWKNEILVAKDENGEVIGTMSVLSRRVPFLQKPGIISVWPRGKG